MKQILAELKYFFEYFLDNYNYKMKVSTSKILLFTMMLLFKIVAGELQQVVVIIRHGARYYWNQLYDAKYLSTRKGELTGVGMRELENLGGILKEEYASELGFIGQSYTPQEVEALTPDDNRSIQSLRSLLYGMYPLGSGPKLRKVPEHLYVPPFPGAKNDEGRQFALPEGYLPYPFTYSFSFFPCPAFMPNLLKTIDSHSQQLQQMADRYMPLITRMQKLFNITQYPNITTMSLLADSIIAARYMGRPLPEGLTAEDQQNMEHIHEWFTFISIKSNLSKAMNSQKLQRMRSFFDGRIRNLDQKMKMSLYMTHDTDITGLMLDLNITTAECVQERYRFGATKEVNCNSKFDFASTFTLQLHFEDGKHVMRMRHDGEYINICGGNSTVCDYDEWRGRIGKLILKDYDKVCSGEVPLIKDV